MDVVLRCSKGLFLLRGTAALLRKLSSGVSAESQQRVARWSAVRLVGRKDPPALHTSQVRRSLRRPSCTETAPHQGSRFWTASASAFGFGVAARLHQVNCRGRHPEETNLMLVLEDSAEEADGSSCSHEAAEKFPWWEFFGMLSPDKWYLLATLVTGVLSAILSISLPLHMGRVADVLNNFSDADFQSFIDRIRSPLLGLLGMSCVQVLLTISYISLVTRLGETFAVRLRQRLFSSLLNQNIVFYDCWKTGELITRLTADVQEFKSSFKQTITLGLKSVTQSLGYSMSMLMLSPQLSGLVFILMPAMILVGTQMATFLKKMSRAAHAQVAKASGVANEALGNITTVQAFAMEDKEIDVYNNEVADAGKHASWLGYGIAIFQGLNILAMSGLNIMVLFAGGRLMSTSQLTSGQLLSFLMFTAGLERSLASMSELFGQLLRGLDAGTRVFASSLAKPVFSKDGGDQLPLDSMTGCVAFKDVSFSYPTRNQVVLANFSLKIPGGKTLALVGPSGGGKSTIVALLERFYDVDEGSVQIDNVDVRSLDLSWLRSHVLGLINQEPVLFGTTVLENIRYGKPGATDEEVFEAAKLANAHNFISAFPNGYHTVVGERGAAVSGGQKQRIAIARALIKNPLILILDEATSALDTDSERLVQEALDRVSKGRTVIVIAHRLSTIRDADLIAVISHGEIVELGNHSKLMKLKGLYWDLVQQQILKAEIEDEGHWSR